MNYLILNLVRSNELERYTKMIIQSRMERKKPEEVVKILADKHDVTERYVQMVISGEKNNDAILTDYLTYKQTHNQLLEVIKKAVPLSQ